MPFKFKRKLTIGLICFIGLIWLGINFRPKTNPTFWWSIVFSNPLKQTNGLTNILLLGMAGGTYDGADLTDTMILMSYNQKNKQTVLIILPRDLWSPTLQAKINTAYHYGGFILAKSIAEEVTGLPVHYSAKIDLSGFKKLVDLLGGVELNIDRSFDDNKFPIEGKEADLCDGDPTFSCRYRVVHFSAGKQILDGTRVLEYIRSRQAEGDEGTDFARSQRQGKVMVAIKKKVLSPAVLLNPGKVSALFHLADEIVDTDLPQDHLPYLWKQIALMGFSQIKTVHFENLLESSTQNFYGQWVLMPKAEDFSQIQKYLQSQLDN